MISLFKLFLIYVKIGAILLGGGYVILPIMISEFCEKRNLVQKDEMIDYFALSQSLPGIIAANMSMFIGYKLRGKSGAFLAMIGVIFVPFFCIVFLATVLSAFIDNFIIKAVLWGVGISVIALIMLTIREMWQNSKIDWFFLLIFVIALFSLLYIKLSPIQTIVVFSSLGVLIKYIRRKK